MVHVGMYRNNMPGGMLLSAAMLVLVMLGSVHSSSFAALDNAYSFSNTVIDVGQLSVANALVTGGSGGPYAGEWAWIGPDYGVNMTSNLDPTNVVPFSQIRYISFNPSGTLAYVRTNFGITVVNALTNQNITVINPGGYLTGGAVNSQGTLAYLTCCLYSSTNTVYVVNLEDYQVTDSINLYTQPQGVKFNPSGTLAYVYNSLTALTVVNVITNTIQGTVNLAGAPGSYEFNPSGTLLYVSLPGNVIDVLNASTYSIANVISAQSTGYGVSGPGRGLLFNPSGTILYALNYSDSSISVIDTETNTVVNTITGLVPGPQEGSFGPSGVLEYTGSFEGQYTTLIDAAANAVMSSPYSQGNNDGVAVSPDGGQVYVGSYTTDNLLEFNPPESAVQALPSGQQPGGLLQLTVNAISSDAVSFTFNGATYTENTLGSGTVYGNWVLYGFAQDAGGNSIALPSSIRVNPRLVASSVSAANSTVAEGSADTLVGHWSGGTPPYAASFSVYNSVNGNVLASGTMSGISSTSGSFTFNMPAGYNSLGAPRVLLTVTDSASYPQSNSLVAVPISSVKAYRAPMSLGLCNAYGFEGSYYLSSAERCSITGELQSPSNQLSGSLYVDNAVVASTSQYSTNSLSYAVSLKPGTYYVSFNSPGNSDYVPEGINVTLVIVNGSVGMGINGGPYSWGYTTSEYNALSAYNVTYLRMDLLRPPYPAYESEISNLTAHGFRIIGIGVEDVYDIARKADVEEGA